MNEQTYDITILGAGVAGVFAAHRLSENKKNKVCLIDFGRPPGKRRKQLEGWFGCFPYSNARLYADDYTSVRKISGSVIAKPINKYVSSIFNEHGPMDIVKFTQPKPSLIKKAESLKYKVHVAKYCQWKPESIHSLSRFIANYLEQRECVNCMFDTEIFEIDKINNKFVIKTENGIIYSKQILLCVGRSGWRFAKDLFAKFGIVKKDNSTIFGFRAEMPIAYMKEWNKSHCIVKGRNICLGPLSWNGTVIPEDHVDLVISSWRSNEDRWRTEKVAFSVLLKARFKGNGLEQTERLGKLAFVLSDNRVGRGRIKDYLSDAFEVSLVPEYYWMKEKMKHLNKLINLFTEKATFHIPDIRTGIPDIEIDKNFGTEIDGLFVAGESAGVSGILSAAISGCIAADGLIEKV